MLGLPLMNSNLIVTLLGADGPVTESKRRLYTTYINKQNPTCVAYQHTMHNTCIILLYCNSAAITHYVNYVYGCFQGCTCLVQLFIRKYAEDIKI